MSVAVLCAILATGLLPGPAPTLGQADPVIDEAPAPTYRFGEELGFSLQAHASADITRVTLFMRAQDDDRTFSGLAQFALGQRVEATYRFDPAQRALSAFTPLEYWWEVVDATGASTRSDPAIFVYLDNRFDWQTLDSADGRLSVHWYDGETEVGQAALDAAVSGYASARNLLPGTQLDRADVYVYGSESDARAVLDSASPRWVSGFANPAGNTAIVVADSDTPDARSRIARDIPHELMHLVAAHASGQTLNMPTWFNEGLAQLNEPTPDPDDEAILTAARADGTLRALADYCGLFPTVGAASQLAYAHSAAVVRYIRNQYGVARLSELISAYAGGLSCEAGVQQTLGLTLTGLDQAWQTGPAVSVGHGFGEAVGGWLVLIALLGVVSPLLFLVALSMTWKPRPVKP